MYLFTKRNAVMWALHPTSARSTLDHFAEKPFFTKGSYVSQITAYLRMLLPRSFTLKHCERYSLTESGVVWGWGGGEGWRGSSRGETWGHHLLGLGWGGGREGWERVPYGVKIPLLHMGFYTHRVNGSMYTEFEVRNLTFEVWCSTSFLFIYIKSCGMTN